MDETQVLEEVAPELRQAVEWDPVPETTTTLALEQPVPHNVRDRAIRPSIGGELEPVRPHNAEALEAPDFPALRVGEDARVRSCVDEDPARREDPMSLS